VNAPLSHFFFEDGVLSVNFRIMDPQNPEDKATMFFMVESPDGKGEADSPAGLVAVLVGSMYADVEDEVVAWRMRAEYLQTCALNLAVAGKRAIVKDGSVEGAVFDPFEGEEITGDEIELRVDGDYAMIASLQRAGVVTLWERGSVFRNRNSVPANCGGCVYFDEETKRCVQFDMPVDETNGCLDGVKKGLLKPRGDLELVEKAELPPERLKQKAFPA